MGDPSMIDSMEDQDEAAVIAALRKIMAGFQDIIDVLEGPAVGEKTKKEKEIALLLEFDRAPGNGLSREEASRVCKRHGFTPQTVGAWARGEYLVTRDDGLRYIGEVGRQWLEENNVRVTY
jgi:hypothetical protein